jgi:hypothetical protein
VMDLFKRMEIAIRRRFCPTSYRSRFATKVTGSLSGRCSLKKPICALKAHSSSTERIPIQHQCATAKQLNKFGAPSEIVAQGYRWAPGTELIEKKTAA